MSANLKLIPAFCAMIWLGACGGGGNAENASANIRFLPTVWTSEGRTLNSCSLSPGCSGNPYAPFFAATSMAPADGAVVNGFVRLEVLGNEMANLELLPAHRYSPRLGVFNLSGDRTRAWLDLDTATLPEGFIEVRISAFSMAAGQAGAKEIIAMPPRKWRIANAGAPRPGAFAASLTSAPPDGAAISGVTRFEVRGTDIANVELSSAAGNARHLAIFNVSADRTLAWLDFDSRTLPDGVKAVQISAFDRTQAQPGAREIIVMPARRWEWRNGVAAPFSAEVTMAPPHDSLLSGRTRLEVRGSGLQNLALLPVTGTPAATSAPASMKLESSFDGTFAWLEFDTDTLPNGILEAKIIAVVGAAGPPAQREIVVMPARQWRLRH